MISYGTILATLFVLFIVTLVNRAPVHLDVLRDRNALYQEASDGRIENVYTLKIINKSGQAQELKIEIAGLPGLSLTTTPAVSVLAGGAVASIVARVTVDRDAAPGGGHDVVFQAVRMPDGAVQATRKARFILPVP